MSKSSLSHPGAVKAIVTAWLVAGTLDILAAFTQFYINTGKNPAPIILKYIASGVLGADAKTGGTGVMLLGLGFHYLIALGCVLAFFWLYPNIKFMRVNKAVSIFLYGILVWVITTQVIVPLSLINKPPFNFSKASIAALILIFMIALPTMLIIGRYYDKRDK